MSCKIGRRIAGVLAGGLWGSALTISAIGPNDVATNQVVILLVSAAAAFGVICGVGVILSKGSSEKVYELGYESGYKAAELASYESRLVSKVTELSAYRR